jgi:RNA polymerase sigma-70 factor (ECF subfamily)
VDLVNALRKLPAKQRTAVVLHHLADLSVEQVAAETGASVSAVKQQLVRGRAALAELLGEVAVTQADASVAGEAP